MVEARPGRWRDGLETDEGEARGGGGDAEHQGIGIVARWHAAERNDGHLLGDGRHRPQHLRPAHDDALAGLADPAQVEEGILLLRGSLGSVDLRIYQHVGEEEVALPYVLVVT